MSKIINKVFGFCSFTLVLLASTASAITNNLPQIQALYGGSIRGLNVIESSGTTNRLRLFLETDFSANSVFYADLNYALSEPFATNNFRWYVVPDFNAQANFGTVSEIAVHQESGRLFVADDDGLFSCTTTAGSLVTNISSSGGSTFLTVCIQDSVLLAIASRQGSNILCFGALDSSGNFTQGAGSPINIGLHAFSSTAIQMALSPSNHCVYIIDSYGTNGIKKSSATYDALSDGTTFSTIPITSVVSNWSLGRQIGFGPEGRMFIGSTVNSINTIAYSDNDGTNWTVVATGVTGKGNNFDTTGSTSQYKVAFGRAISTNKGEAGSWFTLGAGGPAVQIHANDSSTKFDPLNPQIIYFASDQGVGCTTNGGPNLSEIDFGLEAVVIQDLDMNAAKTLGWTASASGLRRGIGTAGALQWAPTGMFPWNDGAPYYSVAIDKADSSGNTIYAGNSVIYKSTDGGTNYLNWLRVYEPAISGELFISSIKAISNTVLAGIYVWSSPYNGGLVYSANGGASWSDISLEGTNGINVNKILLTTESGASVAYVGAEFNINSSLGGHIYRVRPGDVSHVLLSSNNISIRDLALDSTGGIYASGWTENYSPVVFYKSVDSSDWTQLTTNGLSYTTGYGTGRGPVITVGHDSLNNEMPIVGAGVDLYYLSSGASSWTTSSELHYPIGTRFNVLYWDDLLVGTTIGLYGQSLSATTVLADPVIVSVTGGWYVWFSGSGYQMGGPYSLGGSGTPVTGDFDGDRYADPAFVNEDTGAWSVWFSSLGYQMGGPYALGMPGTPVAADFDGDRYADPAMENLGNWYVWFTSLGYQMGGPYALGGSGTPLAADFDGDGYADPAIIDSAGAWSVWFTSLGYQMGGPYSLGVSGTPVAGDFDGDGYADPAIVDSAGAWSVWFTSLGYQMGGPWNLGVSGTPLAADFDGR